MFVCACLLSLAAVGCGRGRERAKSSPSTITVFYFEEAALGPSWDMHAKFLVFLPLVAENATGELESRLAERWERSPDYRDWTVHLRRDVRWHDGVPVTAHDVKFTLDLLSHPAVLEVPPDAFSITVPDDSTYRITCHKQSTGSPLDGWTVYYPKHLLEKLDPKDFHNWDFWRRPVGNGPYRYLRGLPKTMMEFEANPDYYRGKPRIERVVLKFGELSVTEILSGNVDVLPYVQSMDLLKIKGDPRLRVYRYLGPGEGGIPKAILWNQHRPFFRDARVRRALTLAINRRELHQALNLSEGAPIFDVLFTKEHFRRGEIPDPLPYDPEQAKRLLEEAGWRDTDGDGLREREGKPFRFTLRTTAAEGGDKPAVLIFRHLIPNAMASVLVSAALMVGGLIAAEAGLSFLGIGIRPPTPSWGNMLSAGQDALLVAWWVAFFPGCLLAITILCFNLLADGLRDALDVKTLMRKYV